MLRANDNWERLIEKVLRREHDREIAMCHSREPSLLSESSSCNSNYGSSLQSFVHDETDDLAIMLPHGESGVPLKPAAQSYTLTAREIIIVWSDHPQYWTWKNDPTLGYEVAVLKMVWWLDIQGRFRSSQLSEKTKYDIFLVYKLLGNDTGVDKAFAVVRLGEEMAKEYDPEAFTVSLDPRKGRFAKRRKDGWLEIKLGSYFNDLGSNRELCMRLLDKDTQHYKTGLVVRAIELRAVA